MKVKIINKLKGILIVATLFVTLCTNAQTVYEAEIGALNAGAAIKGSPNASQGMVVGNFFQLNSFLKFTTIDGGATGGDANLTIHYANGTGADASLTYHKYVAGSGVAVSQVIFPPTADWNTFADVTISVTLVPGIQAIKFQKVDPADNIPGGGPDIDKITITFGALSVANIAKAEKKQVNVFQNSTEAKIDLNFSGFNESSFIDVSIYSVNGQLVFKQKSSDVNRMSINKQFTDGIYILKVLDNNNASFTKKLIIKN